jgi:hypothetical protein
MERNAVRLSTHFQPYLSVISRIANHTFVASAWGPKSSRVADSASAAAIRMRLTIMMTLKMF